MASSILPNTNRFKKNLNLTASPRNIIIGRGWIFHQDNDSKQHGHAKCMYDTVWHFSFISANSD